MAKRILAFILAMAVFIGTVPAFAAQGRKGASDTAFEKASDEAIFHRIGDWFATRGKSEEEKKAIIAERKAKRAAQRTQKEAEKAKKELEKEGKKAQEKLGEKLKGWKK